VWDNNRGKPGNLIYSKIGTRPEYSENLNTFHRYRLDSAIVVKDTFYIGFVQTVEKLLNIGLDVNRSNMGNNFYTSGGVWLNSEIPATIMIRPVVSRNPIVSTSPVGINPVHYIVYPNPARDQIYIKLSNADSYNFFTFTISDLSGRIVLSELVNNHSSIDISHLNNGLYLISLQIENQVPLTVKKLIINK
jgi:hypothetical protein